MIEKIESDVKFLRKAEVFIEKFLVKIQTPLFTEEACIPLI
ncbi:hypothetical protein ACFP3I_16780 [Chryseobacterium arachidis]